MERLDKMVSARLCISRSDAKQLIRKGLVSVNGQVVQLPEMKCGEEDEVVAQGKPLISSRYIYLMMNKPAGVVSATRDNTCKTVLDLLPDDLRRKGLFPAGRLDKDTEGLLIITDDGAFAHRILSPKQHVPKTYRAILDKPVDIAQIADRFNAGMDLGSGDVTSPAQVRLLEEGEMPEVELVIYEGAYHQVKRMFAKCGAEVTRLWRVKIGALSLDMSLEPGECRQMTQQDLEKIERRA